MLFDLESGREIVRIANAYIHGYCRGQGYVLGNQEQGYNVYDETGQPAFKHNYHKIEPLGDGYYCVKNDVYGGIIDENEQWLIRYCIVKDD